jgi:hypothetical protein
MEERRVELCVEEVLSLPAELRSTVSFSFSFVFLFLCIWGLF